jgi:hypothetical protein
VTNTIKNATHQSAATTMLNKEQSVQESDTTQADVSIEAGNIMNKNSLL